MKVISVLLSYSRRTIILAVFGGIVTGACNAAMLAIVHGALQPADKLRLLWAFIALWILLPISRIASQVTLSHVVHTAGLRSAHALEPPNPWRSLASTRRSRPASFARCAQ